MRLLDTDWTIGWDKKQSSVRIHESLTLCIWKMIVLWKLMGNLGEGVNLEEVMMWVSNTLRRRWTNTAKLQNKNIQRDCKNLKPLFFFKDFLKYLV